MAFSSWKVWLNAILSLTTIVTAYRPVQHCKQLGDNGHYSACTSLTQHYNQSTGLSDLYVRYHWYKYMDSQNGWHAFAIGHRMAGALMFIMYGDPTTSELTVSVRSATGHSPPQLIHDIDKFNTPKAKGRIPEVDIVTQKIKPYDGPFEHPELHLKPTHVGVAELIVRGYARWVGIEVSNSSTAQPFIWSSKFDQDFEGDYSVERSIEMHAFGLGFGFIYADLLNAVTPMPFFGPIDELSGHQGIVEIDKPEPPTPAELSRGEFIIANAHLDAVNADLGIKPDEDEHNPFNDHSNTTPSTMPNDDGSKQPTTDDKDIATPDASSQPGNTSSDSQTKPTYTIKGKTIRDWMWHLHGLLLSLTFFVLYPLGIYLLRSPAQAAKGTSFNHHWTVNGLATVVLAIGCFIGYLQSRSISVWHQYIGLLIALGITAQMVLGWRHHVSFVQFKRKTILSRIHVGLGRVIMPLGFINILSGMKLRQYGWFTMLLVLVLIIVEVVFGGVYLRASHVRRTKLGGAAVAEEMKAQGPGKDDDAEEYFQLAGDEDSDASDDEEAAAAAASSSANKKREEKRAENERLAKLDRV